MSYNQAVCPTCGRTISEGAYSGRSGNLKKHLAACQKRQDQFRKNIASACEEVDSLKRILGPIGLAVVAASVADRRGAVYHAERERLFHSLVTVFGIPLEILREMQFRYLSNERLQQIYEAACRGDI